jgi:hypothetical protein
MKKIFAFALAFCIMCGVSTFAQDMQQGTTQTTTADAPLKNLKGTVKQGDDNKLWFVNDSDNKSWEVMNPEALKGHEGHHVQVSAHVYADKNSIHVMSVKMLKK